MSRAPKRRRRPTRALLLIVALAPFACDGMTIALYRGDGGAPSGGQSTGPGGAGAGGTDAGGGPNTTPLGGNDALGGDSGQAGSDRTGGDSGASGTHATSGAGGSAVNGGAAGTGTGTGEAAGTGGQPLEPSCDPRPLTADELACARSEARPLQCSMVTSTGFRGCRGTGCSVCADALFDYPHYAEHHPCCDVSSTCNGDFYPCSSFCPRPELWDRLPKCGDPRAEP